VKKKSLLEMRACAPDTRASYAVSLDTRLTRLVYPILERVVKEKVVQSDNGLRLPVVDSCYTGGIPL
jgi:hypothetical protein